MAPEAANDPSACRIKAIRVDKILSILELHVESPPAAVINMTSVLASIGADTVLGAFKLFGVVEAGPGQFTAGELPGSLSVSAYTRSKVSESCR